MHRDYTASQNLPGFVEVPGDSCYFSQATRTRFTKILLLGNGPMRDTFAAEQGQDASVSLFMHGRALRVIATGWFVTAAAMNCSAATPELIAPVCAAATEATVSMLSDRFNTALQTRHPDRMSRLYAADAAFKGFASSVPRTEYATVRAYFLYFLQFEPVAKFEERQIEFGCNFLVDAGNLTWTLKASELAQPQKLPVRYRIIYEYNGSDWQIAEHIEELTIANADEVGFTVPDPQSPRVPVAVAPVLAPVVPAVAGFLKRSNDEPRAVSRPLIEKRRQEPVKKATPSPENSTAIKPDAWSIEYSGR